MTGLKRKLILFLTACSIIFSIFLINQRKANAASWGAKSLYTTPKKLAQADKKSGYKLADKVGESAWACHTIKYHSNVEFNADGWLAGSGDGFYYVPVKENVKGKKVNALRVGEVAGNYLSYYAYKSKKLAK